MGRAYASGTQAANQPSRQTRHGCHMNSFNNLLLPLSEFLQNCQSSFLFLQNVKMETPTPHTEIPAKANHNQNDLSSPVFGVL